MDSAKEKTTQEFLSGLWEEYQDAFETKEDFQRTVALWPVCPKCGQRRAVRCPICHRLGDLFPLADADFWDGIDETPGQFKGESNQHSSCSSCGSCRSQEESGISSSGPIDVSSLIIKNNEIFPGLGKPRWNFDSKDSGGDSARETVSFDEKSVWKAPGQEIPISEKSDSAHFETASDSAYTSRTFSVSTPNYHRSEMKTVDLVLEKPAPSEEISEKFSRHGIRLVTCPTCDEPFVPKFLPRCKGCGYSFDGDQTEGVIPEEYDPYEEVSSGRIIFVSVGMVILTIILILFCIYFL